MLVRDLYEFMNNIAPFSTAEPWDNCGLILGSYTAKCEKIMITLDVTHDVVKQAIENRVDLIISHHPVIFSALKTIEYDSIVAKLISAGISVISSHTCFDTANGGMNDILCDRLRLEEVRAVTTDDGFSFRIGFIPQELTTETFAKNVANHLDSNAVCCSHKDKIIKSVAVCSGAGSSVCDVVIKLGIDAFVTGELKYNNVIELFEKDVAVIIAGHFETEQVFKETLKQRIYDKFSDVSVVIADEKGYLTGV